MLENLFSAVLGKLKSKSSSKNSQHDSTVTTTTGARSTTCSSAGTHISGPYSLPTPPPPLQHRTLPYPPSSQASGGLRNNSSTPLSFSQPANCRTYSSSNHNNNGIPSIYGAARKENGNIYMLPDVHRQTPLTAVVGATMDDMNYRLANGAPLDPFKRSTKARMSLPVMPASKAGASNRSARRAAGSRKSQHSLGHIYLQHKGETKQAHLPNELTSIDTIWALFVCAFPQWLSMDYMAQSHVKIYIYNPSCNIFYELQDIDDVKHETVLRIHQSDPMLALGPPVAHLQYQHHQMRLASGQIPPPKPRRMIPMQTIHSTLDQSSMYATTAAGPLAGHKNAPLANGYHHLPYNAGQPFQAQQVTHWQAPYQQMQPAHLSHWSAPNMMSANSQACLRLPDGI